MKIEQEQNAWDVRIVVVGGLVPVLFIVMFGLPMGLGLSLLTYWALSTRTCFRNMESGVVKSYQEAMLHSGEIV